MHTLRTQSHGRDKLGAQEFNGRSFLLPAAGFIHAAGCASLQAGTRSSAAFSRERKSRKSSRTSPFFFFPAGSVSFTNPAGLATPASDRLFNFASPRIRDFQGFKPDSFDGRGGYGMGLQEQAIFPELEVSKVKKIFGMNITFHTSAKHDDEARALLAELGLPFAKGK